MPTRDRDWRFLRRMVAMMLAGFALLVAGALLNPPRALLRRLTKEP